MDINEFQKQQQPRAKRSKLEPFINEIRELKAKGYANWQVREWLASNDVTISLEGFRKFWVKVEQATTEKQNTTARPIRPASLPPLPDQEATTPTHQARLTRKQVAEKLGDQFISDAPSNPIIQRLREKEQEKK